MTYPNCDGDSVCPECLGNGLGEDEQDYCDICDGDGCCQECNGTGEVEE